MPASCVSCATAASGSATSSSTRFETGYPDPIFPRVRLAATRCRVNPALIDKLAWCGMVTRKRLRRIVNTLALYPLAALLIGYFGVNAYNGDRGLKAKEDIERQMATLTAELDRLKAEQAQ